MLPKNLETTRRQLLVSSLAAIIYNKYNLESAGSSREMKAEVLSPQWHAYLLDLSAIARPIPCYLPTGLFYIKA
mgnify:FL=1